VSAVVELCAQLIRNRCVNDGSPGSGHEIRSVETIADYLGTAGTVVEPVPGRASSVVRVPGIDPDAPTLMLMGHTDVVPVTAETWSRDPFGGEVVDGVLWGRGAVDMLNLTAAMAVVTKRVLDGDLPTPPGGLVYLAVADEEAGGVHGAGWLVDVEPELVACDDLLTEIAYPTVEMAGGIAQPVMVAEKGPSWHTLHARGTPGHASAPLGRASALAPLVEAIEALLASEGPLLIGEEWRAFVDGLGADPERAAALVDPERIDDVIARVATEDPGMARYLHACTRLTTAPTVVRAGTKANTIPDRGSVTVDMRLLPGQVPADADRHLEATLGDGLGGLTDEIHGAMGGNASPAAGRLWDAMAAAYRSLGVDRLTPTMTPATTDARFFREKGVRAYGAGWFDGSTTFGEFIDMFHGNDERISVVSLDRTVQLLDRVVRSYGGSP
jgi:acetylornithine deacetylase/succinyl-diaminopimelate desuccinylase-like protein